MLKSQSRQWFFAFNRLCVGKLFSIAIEASIKPWNLQWYICTSRTKLLAVFAIFGD